MINPLISFVFCFSFRLWFCFWVVSEPKHFPTHWSSFTSSHMLSTRWLNQWTRNLQRRHRCLKTVSNSQWMSKIHSNSIPKTRPADPSSAFNCPTRFASRRGTPTALSRAPTVIWTLRARPSRYRRRHHPHTRHYRKMKCDHLAEKITYPLRNRSLSLIALSKLPA